MASSDQLLPTKSPGARLDYGINWRKKGWLEADENITVSNWSINDDSGTVEEGFFTVDRTMIWFKDGLVGRTYTLTNTITTSKGRIDQRDIIIPVDNR